MDIIPEGDVYEGKARWDWEKEALGLGVKPI